MPADEPTGQDAGTQQPAITETHDEDEKLDAAALKAQLKKVRDEAAARRVSEREALKKLAEYETKLNAAEETKLKEQNEFKTLYEKEKAAREKLEAETRNLQLSALKTKVAQDTGLPAALAGRLNGTTEDELKADALDLLKTIPQAQQSGQQRTTSAFPGGQPVKETDEQRRNRIFGGGGSVFIKR